MLVELTISSSFFSFFHLLLLQLKKDRAPLVTTEPFVCHSYYSRNCAHGNGLFQHNIAIPNM